MRARQKRLFMSQHTCCQLDVWSCETLWNSVELCCEGSKCENVSCEVRGFSQMHQGEGFLAFVMGCYTSWDCGLVTDSFSPTLCLPLAALSFPLSLFDSLSLPSPLCWPLDCQQMELQSLNKPLQEDEQDNTCCIRSRTHHTLYFKKGVRFSSWVEANVCWNKWRFPGFL